MDKNTFIDIFCKENNLDLDKLKSNYRSVLYADFRRIFIYLLRDKYAMTVIEIRDFMNKKSHSSIIKSIEVHENYVKFDKKYRQLFDNQEVLFRISLNKNSGI